MEVLLNGNTLSLSQNCTIEDLVKKLSLDGKFAIEINQNIVSKSVYSSTQINAGDHIEIVTAIGGG